MKKLPPEVVEQLMNDEDFLSLDDAGQDEILGEIQKKMGIQQPSENILQKAMKAVKSNPLNVFPGIAAYNYGMEKKNEFIEPALKANESIPGIFPKAENFIVKNVLTDPLGYASAEGGTRLLAFGGKGIGGVAKKVPGFISRTIKKGKDIATSGGNLKKVESQLGEIERSIETGMANKSKITEDLSSEALAQSLKNKGKISSTAKRNTEIYGKTLDDIEERLSQVDRITGKNNMPDRKSYLENVLNKTIDEAEAMGLPPNSPVLSKLRSFQNKFKPNDVLDEGAEAVDMLGLKIPKAPEQRVPMTLDELKNLKNSVFDKTSSGFRGGTSYASPKDKVSELFLKNHGDFMGGLDDEIRIMNKEFAPWARARKFGYKSFKPSSPEETQRGANILERVAGKGKANADNANYLGRLEKGSGRFEGTGDLRGKTTDLAKELSRVDEQIKLLESSKGNLIKRQAELKSLRTLRDRILTGAIGTGAVTAYKAID